MQQSSLANAASRNSPGLEEYWRCRMGRELVFRNGRSLPALILLVRKVTTSHWKQMPCKKLSTIFSIGKQFRLKNIPALANRTNSQWKPKCNSKNCSLPKYSLVLSRKILWRGLLAKWYGSASIVNSGFNCINFISYSGCRIRPSVSKGDSDI